MRLSLSVICLIYYHFLMNKSELVSAVAQKSGLSKEEKKKALDAVLESIDEELKNDGKVVLVGFGTFSVTERSARKGINPRTKEPIDIPAKKVVKFKAGSQLSDL